MKPDPLMMVVETVELLIADASDAAVRAGGGLPSPQRATATVARKPQTQAATAPRFLQVISLILLTVPTKNCVTDSAIYTITLWHK
jgi:hypothetical protein